MSRYQLIDTTTGEVVRQQASIYGHGDYSRRRERVLSSHDQDMLVFCLIGVILGAIIF